MAWQPISEAQHVEDGTLADLLMESGRVYRAIWEYRGRGCAWWPKSHLRYRPIALYEPVAFKVIPSGT